MTLSHGAYYHNGKFYACPEEIPERPSRQICQRWKDNDGLCDGECYFKDGGLHTCQHDEITRLKSLCTVEFGESERGDVCSEIL